MKKGLRMARVAAILLATVSFVGIKDSGVQASDSQGLKGSYIGIGSAPKDADVTKEGDAIVLGKTGLVDYRASVDASTKTNSNGEGVASKFDNNGLFFRRLWSLFGLGLQYCPWNVFRRGPWQYSPRRRCVC